MKNVLKVVCIILVITTVFGIIIKKVTKKSIEISNFSNLGLVVEKNENEIYYNKYKTGVYSYINGNEEKICDDNAYSLNLVGNKIYYITIKELSNILVKEVDLNNNKVSNISKIFTSIAKIYADKNYIYYVTNQNHGGIARINIKTKEEQIILEEKIIDFEVDFYNKKIIYINSESKICSVNLSGTKTKVLSEKAKTNKFQIVDDWIYYYDINENALFRINEKGKKTTLISTLVSNNTYNVHKKFVYYFNPEDKTIRRMQIGKSNKVEILANLNIEKTRINIGGNELYFLDSNEEKDQVDQLYRLKLDGNPTERLKY